MEPVPAMTLIRPEAACTTSEITRSCSSWLNVGDSPVVPTGHRQFVPLLTWNSTCFLSSSLSIFPFLKWSGHCYRETSEVRTFTCHDLFSVLRATRTNIIRFRGPYRKWPAINEPSICRYGRIHWSGMARIR